MLSHIQLLEHRLVDIAIKPVADPSPEQIKEKRVTIHHNLAWGQNPNDPQIWAVRLRVELLPGNENVTSLYLGAIEMMGQFLVHPDIQEGEQENTVVVNGAAVLYTCVREWVANVTSRSLHGMIELPTVNPMMFCPPKNKDQQSELGSKKARDSEDSE